MDTHDCNFYLNRLSKIFFIRQPNIIYGRTIWSFIISLSYPRMHPLSLFFPFLWYVLGSVINPQQLLTIPIVYCYLCSSFLKKQPCFLHKLWFLFWKTFISKIFQKWFQNILKIFFNCNSSVYFQNIVVCNEPFLLGIPEFLDSGCKSWTLDSGRWTLDAGFWTLDSGLWILDSGHWTLDAGLRTLNAKLWTLKLLNLELSKVLETMDLYQ